MRRVTLHTFPFPKRHQISHISWFCVESLISKVLLLTPSPLFVSINQHFPFPNVGARSQSRWNRLERWAQCYNDPTRTDKIQTIRSEQAKISVWWPLRRVHLPPTSVASLSNFPVHHSTLRTLLLIRPLFLFSSDLKNIMFSWILRVLKHFRGC